MGLFDGKVVIVTGSGGGIGRAHALAFAREGARVVVNDVGGARDGSGAGTAMADQVVKEIVSAGGQAAANYDSVSDWKGAQGVIRAAKSAFGRLDILVNNAGILRDKTLLKMEEPMWDAVIAVHLKGAFLCSRFAAEVMVEQGSGVIINTTSIAGLEGNFGQSNYSSAKAGIYGLTMTLSKELAKKGIRVNAVAPVALTRMTEDLGVIPQSMKPECISPVVLWLASDTRANGLIIGVHGNEVFEWKMRRAPGINKDDGVWTPADLAARFEHEIAWKDAKKTPAGSPLGDKVLAAVKALAAVEDAAAVDAAIAALGGAAGGAAPAAAPRQLTEAEQLGIIFSCFPEGFKADKAGDWKATLVFDFAGSDGYSIVVKDGKCSYQPGKAAGATCTVKADLDTGYKMFTGQLDPQKAFMGGKIAADNIADMMKFGAVFSVKRITEIATKKVTAAMTGGASASPAPSAVAPAAAADPVAQALAVLPHAFRADKAGDFKAVYLFDVSDGEPWTLVVKEGKAAVEKGKTHNPTCTIKIPTDIVVGMFSGKVDPNQAYMAGKYSADNLGELMKFGQFFKLDAKAAAAASGAPAGPAAEAPKPEGCDPAVVGKKFRARHQFARQDEMIAYAKATDDLNPRYLDESRPGGIIAPPLYAIRLTNETMYKMASDPELNANLLRLVHGEQEMKWKRPLKPFDLVAPRGQILAVEKKESGELVRCQMLLWCDGEAIHESIATFFIRADRKKDKAAGEKKADKSSERGGKPVAFTQRAKVTADQSHRYAAASGDTNPIHTDDNVAKAAGLPGIILHGMCTMAFTCRAVVDEHLKGDASRLRRLKVRMSGMVFPGDELTTTGWVVEQQKDLTTLGFETANQKGQFVITGGVAEVG